MDYRTLGRNATHGLTVVFANKPAPHGEGRPELVEYVAAIHGVWTAVTNPELDQEMLDESVKWLVGQAYKMVGIELIHPEAEDVHEEARKAAAALIFDLQVLHPRHWHKAALERELTRQCPPNLNKKWAPYFLR